MPTTIIIDSVTLTLKKYPEFLDGTPASTDIILYADPTTGDLKKTTLDTLVANEVHVDGVTITGDGTVANPLVATPTPTPDLDAVLTVGNTSDQPINLTGSSVNVYDAGDATIFTGIGSGYITMSSGTSTTIGIIHADNISGIDRDYQLPNNGGTFVVTVNGVAADTSGNIDLVTGGGAMRFGVSGEDASATQSRGFNLNGYDFAITESGVFQFSISNSSQQMIFLTQTGGYLYSISLPTTGLPYFQIFTQNVATSEDTLIRSAAFAGNTVIDLQSLDSTGSHKVAIYSASGIYLTSTGYANTTLFAENLPAMSTETNILFYDPGTGQVKYGAASGVGTDTNFAANDLTATGNRTHTFAANTCEITFNSLAGGTGFAISATTTAATGSLQKLATIALGGVNANTGETSYALTVNNTHTGTNAANYGIYSNVTGGVINYAVYATSSTANAIAVQGYTSASGGVGVVGVSDLGTGINGQSGGGGVAFEFIVSNNSNSTVSPIGRIERYVSSGGGADGIGVSVDFIVETATDNNYQTSNQIISKWTTATTASRVSQCIITGVNSAVSGDILTLNGNKSVQFNGYGSGTFTGTAAKWLAVDSSGNIIEQAPPSAGTGKYIPLAVISSPVTFSSGADNAVLTYAMPANTLNTNGQRIRFVAGMIHTLTSSTNDFRLAFTGGNAGSMDTTTSSQISYHAELIRRSSTEAEVVTFKTKTDGTCDIITKTVSGLDWTSIVTFHFYVSINGSGSVVTHMCALDFIDAP